MKEKQMTHRMTQKFIETEKENNRLICIEDRMMILLRWMEDPEYHEEIIYRRMEPPGLWYRKK